MKPGQIGDGRWRPRDTTGLSASARRAPARECHVDTEVDWGVRLLGVPRAVRLWSSSSPIRQ
eukprot:3296226-Alexandrium_andersonii.AAC.1